MKMKTSENSLSVEKLRLLKLMMQDSKESKRLPFSRNIGMCFFQKKNCEIINFSFVEIQDIKREKIKLLFYSYSFKTILVRLSVRIQMFGASLLTIKFDNMVINTHWYL